MASGPMRQDGSIRGLRALAVADELAHGQQPQRYTTCAGAHRTHGGLIETLRMEQLGGKLVDAEERADGKELAHGAGSEEYRAALELWNAAIEALGHYIDEVHTRYDHGCSPLYM